MTGYYCFDFCRQEVLGGTVVFSGNCRVTGKPVSVSVPVVELRRWKTGMQIQNALQSVSADDREFLMNGFSKEGWDKMFGKEEEE